MPFFLLFVTFSIYFCFYLGKVLRAGIDGFRGDCILIPRFQPVVFPRSQKKITCFTGKKVFISFVMFLF